MDEFFERMGGFDGAEIIAKDFTDRVLADSEIYGYSSLIDSDRIAKIQRIGMALLLGASSYENNWMRKSSSKLISETDFSDAQFDKISQHLVDSLYSFNTRNYDIARVIDFIQTTKNSVILKDRSSLQKRDHLSQISRF